MSVLAPTITELQSVAQRCAAATQLEAAALSDDVLLDHQRALAGAARLVEAAAASLAAEVARRSRPELGYSGLAQQRGSRTAENLIQSVTGASSPAARRLVRVGTMVAQLAAHDSDEGSPVDEPWLDAVVRAAVGGRLSAEAVEAIRQGLGTPSEDATPDALAEAARRLVFEAADTTGAIASNVETLAARARELRDALDSAGVAVREQERRDRRYLRLFPQLDGMTRISGLLDPESAAIVTTAIDAATSPRRGGPRFVDPGDVERAAQLTSEERTTEQLALDTLVDLFDIAIRSRDSGILGARRPDVRVLVTQPDLDRRAGVGFIDGQRATVSIATVERHACDGGLVPVLFDGDGSALNLGRTQRLHNGAQRTAIAARDGGCLMPECERPAAWCEVHHIVEFGKGGRTDVADGVLLCRHHHLLVHNNGWRIDRHDGRYWLVPPPEIDPERTPVMLHTKSAAIRRLLHSA